eukprot:CAMPEP_0114359562 /NCGR_PEP_ID=MMETSP0101-20121206/23114_1 /TAXON_ID=38822 ORGANISM="Pteridomonas danica, Strain PT" /NCGR_SAMPLE_ID=MMETSP0101 /ASSEMBLY_ACC=CAM_ASM_000211 /LENGTH=380 /DNA_ID=CAMNT_0001503175 /DNA_START=53 /DNA_END=1195 /DNA_ORIENTATION=+
MTDFIFRNLAKHFPVVRSGYSMKRGAQALVRGDGIAAVNHFKEAVEVKTLILKSSHNATVAQAMVQLASAYRLSGDEKEATKVLTDALDILQETSPSDPDLHIHMNNLGVLLRNTNQYPEARAIFSEATKMFSERENILSNINVVMMNAGRNELLYGKDLFRKQTEAEKDKKEDGEEEEEGEGLKDNKVMKYKSSYDILIKAEDLFLLVIEQRRNENPKHENEKDYQDRYHGKMVLEKDETLGLALTSLAEAYIAQYVLLKTEINEMMKKNHNDNQDDKKRMKLILEKALLAMDESIDIKKTLHDEDGNKEADLILLKHQKEEIINLLKKEEKEGKEEIKINCTEVDMTTTQANKVQETNKNMDDEKSDDLDTQTHTFMK